LSFNLSISKALHRAEERADALAAKLEISETTRKKAEKDAAAVEGLRQRLKTAEDTLSDKVGQQIERENAIVTRFDTQNRRFTSKSLFSLAFCFCLCLFLDVYELVVFSSRAYG
jgi:flagellar motility protein MotE (MotC chaperone)